MGNGYWRFEKRLSHELLIELSNKSKEKRICKRHAEWHEAFT